MIEVRPTEVLKGVYPSAKILLPTWWVKFSNGFPDSLKHVKGKYFTIEKQQQVRYELSWIVKENCYVDVNLSNEDTGKKLYPNVAEHLYEMLIGFKPGNYLCHVYFPADYPIYSLDYPGMTPLITSDTYKYLGHIKPTDSPIDNPAFKLYLVYDLKPVILRLYADDGVDYEKLSVEFTINRCVMKEQPTLAPGVDLSRVKLIHYLDEIKWIGAGA